MVDRPKPSDARVIAFADDMMAAFGRGPLSDAEIEIERKRPVAVRTFVCQGCGKVSNVLHGRSIICVCGTRSAAEIVNDR